MYQVVAGKRFQIKSLMVAGALRFVIKSRVDVSGGQLVRNKVDKVENRMMARWDIYFQRKAAYDDMASNIKAMDIVKYNWVRIPPMDETRGRVPFDLALHLKKETLEPYRKGEAIQKSCAAITDFKFKNKNPNANKQTLQLTEEEDIVSQSAGGRLDIDELITTEDERISKMSYKNLKRTKSESADATYMKRLYDYADIFDFENIQNESAQKSYQRYYDYIERLEAENSITVYNEKSHEQTENEKSKGDAEIGNVETNTEIEELSDVYEADKVKPDILPISEHKKQKMTELIKVKNLFLASEKSQTPKSELSDCVENFKIKNSKWLLSMKHVLNPPNPKTVSYKAFNMNGIDKYFSTKQTDNQFEMQKIIYALQFEVPNRFKQHNAQLMRTPLKSTVGASCIESQLSSAALLKTELPQSDTMSGNT